MYYLQVHMGSILTIGNNKSKCQHFTPSKIVESMLDLAGYKENLIGITVLENSFGSGNIIKAVVKRYIEDALSKGVSTRKIANGLGRDIYGIELDGKLYSECIESLNLMTYSYGITNVKWQLFNDNALLHQYNKTFDLVIGNPPYISYKEIDEENRQFLKDNFTVCKLGKPDYCYAFIELGVNLLSEKGKLVQLIPNNIYKNVFAEQLRALLKTHISVVRDYPNQKLFGKALTSISVFLYDKSDSGDRLNYENVTDGIRISIPRSSLAEKWLFAETKDEQSEYIRFGDVFNASVAIATLCNKAFVLNPKVAEEKEIEADVLRATVSPKTLRYENDKKIIFPYYYQEGALKKYEDFEQRFPNATKHLMEFCDDLKGRDSDKSAKWYEYGRSQALAHLDGEKLLVSTIITNNVEIYQLDKTTIPYSGIYITVLDQAYTLQDAMDILTSEAFMNYVRNIGISVSGRSLRITCKDINNYTFERR